MKKATLAGKRIEALLKDGQVARARHVFEEYRDEFIENDDERLRAMILKQEGGDVRTTLEENYARTGDLLDLQNLVQEVGRSSDWGALLPLLEDLFRRERTTGNACRLVECMQRHPKSGSAAIKAFFDNNQDVTQWNDDLKSSQAWALFHTGYLRAARTINDQLVKNRNNPTDLWLDMNLAIQAGDWERFPAIVEREWEKRDTYDPTLLLQLASLAAEADASANRAFELAKLAASKAPDDPSVLMKAYSLTVQLGRENDADPSWMTRAVELSSDSGPVHRVDMRTLVQKMMPAHRERERFIERNLLKGEVPLHVAASVLNMALSRILIDIPRRNAEQSDGRRRVIIPICSGARQSIGLQPSSVIGLDVTSLMLLGFLNLLRTVLNAFSRTVLAPETMVVLLNERRRVCFHQPSRIKNAEEIREIIEKGQLKPVKSSVQPPSWLVDEVGSDFAEMLEMARINHGYVVRPRPIYQLSTFLEKEADLKDYGQLILSTNGLAGLLVNAGKLSRELHEQAKKYLMAHDKGPEVDTRTISSIFAASFYLDDLAVTYLQQVGILQSVCRSGLDLWVHPSMREEQSTLVTAKRESERLNDRIDDIRCALREALDNGKIVFLPHHDEDDNESVGSLTGFLSDSGLCSTVCIDDRYINRHGSLTDKKGNNIPITCVLDLIHYLEAQGSIDTAKKWDTLHRLREAGFSLIPIEPDELEHLLRAALFDQDNHLIESPELRIIRQQLMHIRSSGMIQNTLEAPYLTRLRLTCILNIRRLWQDENLSVDRTLTLTSWVWENLAPSPVDWEPNAQSAEANSLIRTAYIEHLTPLFSPLGRLTPVRYEAFLEWIERAVLEPLLPANNHLIDDVAEQLKIQIGQLVQRLSDGIDQSPNC